MSAIPLSPTLPYCHTWVPASQCPTTESHAHSRQHSLTVTLGSLPHNAPQQGATPTLANTPLPSHLSPCLTMPHNKEPRPLSPTLPYRHTWVPASQCPTTRSHAHSRQHSLTGTLGSLPHNAPQQTRSPAPHHHPHHPILANTPLPSHLSPCLTIDPQPGATPHSRQPTPLTVQLGSLPSPMHTTQGAATLANTPLPSHLGPCLTMPHNRESRPLSPTLPYCHTWVPASQCPTTRSHAHSRQHSLTVTLESLPHNAPQQRVTPTLANTPLLSHLGPCLTMPHNKEPRPFSPTLPYRHT